MAVYGDAFEPKKENWPDIQGEVEFKDVMFKYNKGEKVLDDFNLKVKPGETLALVGETGSGKSTIVNLICRFYEPVEGEILIDGVDTGSALSSGCIQTSATYSRHRIFFPAR